MEGPLEKFCDDMERLIDEWRAKPEDDKLTMAQVVGAMETVKFKLLREAYDDAND